MTIVVQSPEPKVQSLWSSYRGDPIDDRVFNLLVDGRLMAFRISSTDLERVIAAVHSVQRRRGGEAAEDRFQFRWRAECVAAALHEQHRPPNVWKMCVTSL